MKANGPGQSAYLLLDVVAALTRQNIDYAVIGAMAASVHGVVRASLDADALLSSPVEQLKNLATEFKDLGLETDLRRGDVADPIAAVLRVSDSFGNSVDLLTGLRGFPDDAFSRVIRVSFHGTSLRIIGLEDFIAMKLFAGGPLDIHDARRAIKAADLLDVALLTRLTHQYGPDVAASLQTLLNSED